MAQHLGGTCTEAEGAQDDPGVSEQVQGRLWLEAQPSECPLHHAQPARQAQKACPCYFPATPRGKPIPAPWLSAGAGNGATTETCRAFSVRKQSPAPCTGDWGLPRQPAMAQGTAE